MFARKVFVRLKPATLVEFTQLFEQKVLPILRLQPGFRDQITLVNEEGTEITTITAWDSKQQASRYDTTAYMGVLKQLEPVLDGPPIVRGMKVISSTVYNIAAASVA